ncbi:MAG: hypothetical protein R3C10_04980 [Pirellulales bacterium]
MTWPDGVLQTEMDLATGRLHHIDETQRQLSSCPVLFAFNGQEMSFVTDALGVGGIGYNVGAGEYAAPRPRESVLLPADSLVAERGEYRLAIAEPMEEVCYLDAVALRVIDVPAGWHVAVDERLATLSQPSGEPRFYQHTVDAARAVDERGEDVTALIHAVDHNAALVGEPDRRFIGRTTPGQLVIEFPAPLDTHTGEPALLVDGWLEYPYSQTMFSAWQAGATYDAPTLEVLDAAGDWQLVDSDIGCPAGMPRQLLLPIPTNVTAGAAATLRSTTLRVNTNLEIYWDRIALVWLEPCSAAAETQLDVTSAVLSSIGFPRRTTMPQRRPHYDFAHKSPLWDTRTPAGWYTALGPVDQLLRGVDDAVVVFGPGEAVDVRFSAPPDPPEGCQRHFVVRLNGWCKDMDLYTQDGDTVEPLPSRPAEPDSQGTDANRQQLHDRYLTRYRDGT